MLGEAKPSEVTLEGSNSAETLPPGVGGVRLHTGKICEVSGSLVGRSTFLLLFLFVSVYVDFVCFEMRAKATTRYSVLYRILLVHYQFTGGSLNNKHINNAG